jgi:Tat protein translocase TatC
MSRPTPPLDERMSFGDHIEALRWHLIRALFGIALCMGICLINGRGLLDFLLAPLRQALAAHNAGQVVVKGIMEGFAAFFEISLLGGLVLASPWVIYQLWGFLAPGLYPHEKRLVYRSVPFLLGLFLVGALFGWFCALPSAVDFMVGFNLRLGFQLQITVSSWVSFAIVFPLAFGLAFELPLAMVVLSKIGLVSGASFRRRRKMAILVVSIISAVLTPTPDPLGMMVMFVPLVLLYEAGLLCVSYSERRPDHNAGPSDDLIASLLVPVVAGHLAKRAWADRAASQI